jgi:hypothetical protein
MGVLAGTPEERVRRPRGGLAAGFVPSHLWCQRIAEWLHLL